MTTEVTCAGCGAIMERYEDNEPLVEVPEGLCPKCVGSASAFDRALDAHQGMVPIPFEELLDDPEGEGEEDDFDPAAYVNLDDEL